MAALALDTQEEESSSGEPRLQDSRTSMAMLPLAASTVTVRVVLETAGSCGRIACSSLPYNQLGSSHWSEG